MTPRYLILARGDHAQRRAIAERVTGSTGLAIVAELPTALVVADRATNYGLPLKPLVLGDMFARQTGERIDERERGGCLTSPDTMLRTAWGRYFAMFSRLATTAVERTLLSAGMKGRYTLQIASRMHISKCVSVSIPGEV
ncbi:hypothetical protein [Sphingomonas japonica]|uniref:Uncharacterized protein n=1 Tax=Sphingomonas japonica TaxID=511662 RepID=A0ABX0U3P6_9SPHN|nr:hypothetical protein [Sphingomonas japonica]NIJ25201.1 hypothetical protein [Sphingomonas japonica]